MKVSTQSALNYVSNETYFFATRSDRNSVFPGDNIEQGTTIAVADDDTVDTSNHDSESFKRAMWSIEKFNGVNWVLESIDGNYALTITDEGLAALADINNGKYVFEISCIKVKQNNIIDPSIPLTSWTDATFISEGDIVLNTGWGYDVFSVDHNLRWRNSLGNSGMQLTLNIDSDVYGIINKQKVDNYTVGAIGIYIRDQRDTGTGSSEGKLFAIGNLSAPINKYTTNANRVGNSIKLYFNLVLSNLGYMDNIISTPEDFNSIPEISDETLIEGESAINQACAYPYNIYLVDNYQNTNSPAIALRTVADIIIGDDGVPKYQWKWTYITPQDDTIKLTENDFSREEDREAGLLPCQDYMAVAWDNAHGKFVPASGDNILSGTTRNNNVKSVLTGIKIKNTIVFAGNIKNFTHKWQYSATLSDYYKGKGYRTGDVLYRSFDGKKYYVMVSNVNTEDMSVMAISEMSPNGGSSAISDTNFNYWYCARRNDEDPSFDMTKVAKISVQSTKTIDNTYIWNFPANYLNKPLYADVGNNAGKFTTSETECFIGWCTGTGENGSSIKLALDLRNEATDKEYGTTRYATYQEVNNYTASAREVTSINPKTLKENYLQIRMPGSNEPSESDIVKNNVIAGSTADHPIIVDTHTKFTKKIVSTVENDVAFQGIAYRAYWGDLAEYYEADRIYPAGTLITMGAGSKEVTIATKECNGIVSDKPGYELGEKLTDHHIPIALIGKVPVIFDDKCYPSFGDRIYLSKYEDGKASTENYGFCLGKIIDKRPNLENHRNNILCSIRLSF